MTGFWRSEKEAALRMLLIRMFTQIGRELVFSADLCYNGLAKSLPPGVKVALPQAKTEGARVTLSLRLLYNNALSLSQLR